MKWGFKEKYGLQTGVLHKTKTNTRREPFEHDFKDFRASFDKDNRLCVYDGDKLIKRSKVGIGDVVAVAQPYKELYPNADFRMVGDEFMTESAGWNNKMYVREDLMIHKVKVTGIKAERLKDISREDCMKEGILNHNSGNHRHKRACPFYFAGGKHSWDNSYSTPRQAFAALIDKVSGKGTWKRNPWVFVYSFKLVK